MLSWCLVGGQHVLTPAAALTRAPALIKTELFLQESGDPGAGWQGRKLQEEWPLPQGTLASLCPQKGQSQDTSSWTPTG